MFGRRHLLMSAGSGALGFAAGWFGHEVYAMRSSANEPMPNGAQEALDRLKAGNERFVIGKRSRRHQSAAWRHGLEASQHPFATVLGCSDSRVPIELIFDQGFGDLFIVRVAGNVVADAIIASLAYALAHVHTPLVLVLGHEGCGAVTAALEGPSRPGESQRLEELLRLIDPGLRDLDPGLQGSARVSAAVEANVRWSMRQLSDLPAGRRLIAAHMVLLVGGVYDLDTGLVRFLD
jgi:carbonic anhydrase